MRLLMHLKHCGAELPLVRTVQMTCLHSTYDLSLIKIHDKNSPFLPRTATYCACIVSRHLQSNSLSCWVKTTGCQDESISKWTHQTANYIVDFMVVVVTRSLCHNNGSQQPVDKPCNQEKPHSRKSALSMGHKLHVVAPHKTNWGICSSLPHFKVAPSILLLPLLVSPRYSLHPLPFPPKSRVSTSY